jgi:hypothetical protein
MAKHKAEYKLKDLYNYYTEKVHEDLQVPYSVYAKILKEFNLELVDLIINHSEGVKLPSNLGYIRVRKRKVDLTKTNKLIPDWATTNKLWKENPEAKAKKQIIFHLNEHRGGYKYKIFWDRSKPKLKHKSFYYFIPTRAFKRKLASVLKNNFEIDYYL